MINFLFPSRYNPVGKNIECFLAVAPYLVLSHGLRNKPVLGCGSNVVDHVYSVKGQ